MTQAATVGSRSTRSPATPGVKRNFLKEVATQVKRRPGSMVIYGPPGVGKSSLGAQIPGCVFLCDSGEDGINTLKDSGRVRADIPVLPPATTWADTLAILEQLATEEHPYRAVVVDALGGFERLCHEHVCRRDYGNNWGKDGFVNYQAGYDTSLADWRQFLQALDRLRDERGMAVCLLAHVKVAPYKNPNGPDYDKFQVDVHHKTWALTHKWADMVLFCNAEVATTKEGGRIKGKGGKRRVIYTEGEAAFDAKHRHGLPDEIDMGSSGAEAWANLTAALKAAKEAGNGTV